MSILRLSRWSGPFLAVPYIAIMLASSVSMGIVYAILNTDPHHWGFIAGTALDFINGRKLFSEAYIQYGLGQPLLFAALNGILQINYTSVGILTAFIYAAFLIFLFLSLRLLISLQNATLLVTLVFLIHPYAIYPWPDYYAGLFLCLFSFVILRSPADSGYARSLLPAALLFIAFLFRSTYITGIALAFGALFLAAFVNQRLKNKLLFHTFANFLVLCLLFSVVLNQQNNLYAWYYQAIGAATAGDGYSVGWKAIPRLIIKFVYPFNSRSIFVLTLVSISIYVIVDLLFKRQAAESGAHAGPAKGTLFFLAALGIGGLTQMLQHFEMFRILNSGAPMIIVAGYALSSYIRRLQSHSFNGVYLLLFGWTLGIFSGQFHGLLLGKNNSVVWPLVEFHHSPQINLSTVSRIFGEYEGIDAEFFRMHLFDEPTRHYYVDLMALVCDGRSDIINTTMDSSVPYLCKGQRNALMLPFYSESLLMPFQRSDIEAIHRGNIPKNQIIVVDEISKIKGSDMTELDFLGSVVRPNGLRFIEPGSVSIYRSKSP